MAELKTPLVIDKSFARWKTGALAKLARKHTLLVPSAFFYEVFTTEPKNRVRELKNFPNFRRVHIPVLQHLEQRIGKPVISIDAHVSGFNPAVESESWKLSAEHEKTVEKHRAASVQPMVDFWRQALASKDVPGFTESELKATKGSRGEFIGLCEPLRDEQRMGSFADSIGWAHAAKLDSTWFHFRLFQAWALQGLVLLRRYQNPGDVVSERGLEHDVQDIEYLMLGLHAGALATAETSNKLEKASMSWRFRTLDPSALLVVP